MSVDFSSYFPFRQSLILPKNWCVHKLNFLVNWTGGGSMKKSRFTDSQIKAVLKQTEAGTPVAELYREHGMSSAGFYKWCSRCGGMVC